MYQDRKLNAVFATVSGIALVIFWMFIRQQASVSDSQFLRSMIPHHGAAILMCEQASIQDASIKDLCRRIVTSQQAEIDQMRVKLGELSR